MKRIIIKTDITDDEAGDVAARIDDILPDDYEISIEDVTFWLHKITTHQSYGGPEEGGWWYDAEAPIDPDDPDYMPPIPFSDKEKAYEACRGCNHRERERRETLGTGYTSVLSYRETFYSYTVTESEVFTPEPRPHYE